MKKIILQLLFLAILVLFPAQAFAQPGFDPSSRGEFEFQNPLVSGTANNRGLTISELVGRVIFTLLSLVGVLAAFTFIRAGINIGMAAGRQDMVDKGQKGLLWGVIGLAVVFAGFVVVNFVIGRIQTVFAPATTPESTETQELEGATRTPDGEVFLDEPR
jgi:uncharacterized membrane protein